MKICGDCGASNPDRSKFCGECGAPFPAVEASPQGIPETLYPEPAQNSGEVGERTLPTVPETIPPTILPSETESGPASASIDAGSIASALSERVRSLQQRRQADVLFVLDCTASMQGEINAIKDAIIDFADSIQKEGVRVRVGLIEFRDRLIGEEQRVLTFDGEIFTSNPDVFRSQVSKLRASGGGDIPESSLDATILATQQPFSQDGSRVIVLITDAPPHIPDKDAQSVEEVVGAIQSARIDQLYLVMRTQDKDSQIYLKLLEGTKGLAFELGKGDDFRERAEDFKRTLMALGKTISQATR